MTVGYKFDSEAKQDSKYNNFLTTGKLDVALLNKYGFSSVTSDLLVNKVSLHKPEE